MPKAIKRKIKKKEMEGPDVAGRISDIRESLKVKQRVVVTYGVLAAVIVIVIAGILLFQFNAGQQARQMESEAYKVYYGQYSRTPLPAPEKYEKALDLFKKAYATKKSPRVLLYIASSYYELGRYDEALNTLKDFIKRYSGEKDLLPLAYQEMASVQIKKGNNDEALKTLDTLYKLPSPIYKDAALFQSARILESEGKKDEAKAKYKELTEKFKDSPYYEEAKAKTAENAEQKQG